MFKKGKYVLAALMELDPSRAVSLLLDAPDMSSPPVLLLLLPSVVPFEFEFSSLFLRLRFGKLNISCVGTAEPTLELVAFIKFVLLKKKKSWV